MSGREIHWRAPEHEHHPKTAGWYWGLYTISLLFIGISLWLDNFLFVLFLVIATILIAVHAGRAPEDVPMALSTDGLQVGDHTAHSLQSFSGFAVISVSSGWADWSILVLRRRNTQSSYVKLFIPTREIPAFRSLLSPLMPEIEYEESLAEHLFRLLKF